MSAEPAPGDALGLAKVVRKMLLFGVIYGEPVHVQAVSAQRCSFVCRAIESKVHAATCFDSGAEYLCVHVPIAAGRTASPGKHSLAQFMSSVRDVSFLRVQHVRSNTDLDCYEIVLAVDVHAQIWAEAYDDVKRYASTTHESSTFIEIAELDTPPIF